MEDLGDFFFKISRQKKQNFALISDHCSAKVNILLDKLNTRLNDFMLEFNEMRHQDGMLALGSRQMSHMSDKEEEKVPGDLVHLQSLTASKSKGP